MHKQVSDKTDMTKLLENHESVILPANLQSGDDWDWIEGTSESQMIGTYLYFKDCQSVRPVMEDPIHIRHLVSAISSYCGISRPDKNQDRWYLQTKQIQKQTDRASLSPLVNKHPCNYLLLSSYCRLNGSCQMALWGLLCVKSLKLKITRGGGILVLILHLESYVSCQYLCLTTVLIYLNWTELLQIRPQ